MSIGARLVLSIAIAMSVTAPVVAQSSADRGTPPTMTWIDPDREPKAVLLCVHGLGLHNESYKNFGERMAKQGVATYAVDVRGFGSFVNRCGKENAAVDFEKCLENDIKPTLKVIRRAHRGLPVFILGESMGGAIALRATERYPDLVDGLISCVPSGDRFHQGRTELKVATQLIKGANRKFDIGSSVVDKGVSLNTKSALSGKTFGGLQKASDQKAQQRLEQRQKDWLEDALNRKELSPKELIQFQKFMNQNHESAAKITSKPVLMVQGWNDSLVKATGTLQLWEELGTPDKDFVPIWGATHLIFEESQYNDPACNAKVDRVVVRWLADHIKKQPTAGKQQATSLN